MRIHLNFSHAANYLRENIFSSLSEQNKKIMTYVSAVFIFLAAFFLTYRYCKKTTLPFKAAEQDPQQPLISSKKESSTEKFPNASSLGSIQIEDAPKQFNKYELELIFSNDKIDKHIICVNTPSDIKSMIKIIKDKLVLNPHAKALINFSSPSSDEEMLNRIQMYQKSDSILQFELSKDVANSITASVKLLNSDIKGHSQERVYANGVKEVFDTLTHQGNRTLPNGVRIFGYFDSENIEFFPEYRIESNGKIKFINPLNLIEYTEKSSDTVRNYAITPFQKKLIIVEKISATNEINGYYYEKVEKPLLEALWTSVEQINSVSGAKQLKMILKHQLFKDDLSTFIQQSLMVKKESGTPRLFTLHSKAAAEIVAEAAKQKSLDPLKTDASGKNFFIYAAELAKDHKYDLLAKLIEHFPSEFTSILPQIKNCLPIFIHDLLYPDHHDIPYLFGLPSATGIEILNAAIKENIKIKFPTYPVQVYTAAAKHENPQFLQKLIEVVLIQT